LASAIQKVKRYIVGQPLLVLASISAPISYVFIVSPAAMLHVAATGEYVLLVSVSNCIFPVTPDVFNTIFSPYGKVVSEWR